MFFFCLGIDGPLRVNDVNVPLIRDDFTVNMNCSTAADCTSLYVVFVVEFESACIVKVVSRVESEVTARHEGRDLLLLPLFT
jgi:hypothetical protein